EPPSAVDFRILLPRHLQTPVVAEAAWEPFGSVGVETFDVFEADFPQLVDFLADWLVVLPKPVLQLADLPNLRPLATAVATILPATAHEAVEFSSFAHISLGPV